MFILVKTVLYLRSQSLEQETDVCVVARVLDNIDDHVMVSRGERYELSLVRLF